MPTVLRDGPYRFFFYAVDEAEPPHVHVRRDRDEAKFWLDPVQLAHNKKFSLVELNRGSCRSFPTKTYQRLECLL